MHPYATDSHERKTVPFVLAVIATVLALGLAKIVEAAQVQNLWWLDVPAVWGFYGILWRLFDRSAWRWRVLRAVGLVRVPDLNGPWHGRGVSSHVERAGDRQEFECDVTITQRWRTLYVSLQTAHSQSESVIGALLVGDGGGQPILSYEYRNEPRTHAPASLNPHRGTARLALVAVDHLEGDYYTGRDRREIGTLDLRRVRGR